MLDFDILTFRAFAKMGNKFFSGIWYVTYFSVYQCPWIGKFLHFKVEPLMLPQNREAFDTALISQFTTVSLER